MQKRLNGPRCRLGCGVGRIRWGADPPRESAIFRGKNMPGHARRHSAVSGAKMAQPTEMPFGLWTQMGSKKHVLHRGSHCRNLADTPEPSVCGGNVAFLSNYFDHLLIFLPWYCNSF